MKFSKIALAFVALGLSAPAFAASTVAELEARIKALEARLGEGLDDETKQNISRTTLKVENIEDQHEKLGTKNLKISGYMDPTYIWTSNQNRTGFQFLNQQSGTPYEYAFDNGNFGTVQLDFQKEMEGGTKFRITLMPERGGLGNSISSTSIVHEASIYTPLGSNNLYAFGGQIPDWSGYEMSQANQNKLVTHNLLFDFAGVTGYTGAGLNWISGPWNFKALLGQISSSKNNSILKGNAAQDSNDPTIAVRADYSISEFMGVGMAALHGLYANGASTGNIGGVANPAKTMLDSIEIDAWYLKGALSLGGQVSAGQQKQAAFLGGKDASWYGVSGMASYAVATGHDVSLRADYINNKANGGGIMGYPASSPAPIDNGNGASTLVDGRNGFGTRSCNPTTGSCDGANRWALSLGYRYTINPNVAIKTEFRLDGADQDVFMDVGNNTYTNINKLVGMSLVASF